MAGSANPAATAAPRMAGATPMPSAVNPAAGNNIFSQASGAVTDAMGGARNIMGFQGQQVGTQFGYSPERVAAERAAAGIQTYMNPYTQEVIDRSMQDIGTAQQQAMNQLGAQATAARAFGGSRQGVAEALTNQNFINQLATTAAGLRQQGFQTALGASQQDVANQMQAALANQAATSRATEFGQGTTLQAEMANQAAAQNAANLRLQAAGQLGGFGQQAFGMGQGIVGMQQDFGRQQQTMNQALIDAARGQFGGFAGAPQTSIGLPLQAVGAANMGQQTQTQRYNPGLFDYLSLAATIPSDRRLKTNIRPLGARNGIKLYSWDWNEDGKKIADPAQPTVGVMADELMQTHPHLVMRASDGYLRVNYGGLQTEIGGGVH